MNRLRLLLLVFSCGLWSNARADEALDERGQAVQTMRSITYLQPGENASCVGCHEPRTTAPTPRAITLALKRPPSDIAPGPDGSRPLSYPILVQPVLDKHCVRCHSSGRVVLTGAPQGRYTVSYNTLAPRVSFSAWGRPGGNGEPLTQPDFFGARGSALMKMLLRGHNKVALGADDIERLATWMDANALFYGTFDPADQARQQRGERIAGPTLE
jgi:cytochrome c553